jgi:glutamate synthase (ferredoxin)
VINHTTASPGKQAMSNQPQPFPTGLPPKQGLYNPSFEHDACGTGFVVNTIGVVSHKIIEHALTILDNLYHRGASGSESNTGDGAGVLIQTPHTFLENACNAAGFELPGPRYYGVGMFFMPTDDEQRLQMEKIFEKIVLEEGQRVLGWRTVPTDGGLLGATARAAQPVVRQVFIERSLYLKDRMSFERKLYVIRKSAEKALRYGNLAGSQQFYICSLSYKTVIYKGMLTSTQVRHFFNEL